VAKMWGKLEVYAPRGGWGGGEAQSLYLNKLFELVQ
jgi:hypothetical protein